MPSKTLPRMMRKGLLTVTVLGLPLAACAPDRIVTSTPYPRDYRERHPIILTEGARSLDIFSNGPKLDARQQTDIRTFASEYRRFGKGTIIVQVPTGDRSIQHTLHAIKGLLGGYVSVTSYHPADPSLASPIRLSFHRMEAKVAKPCGTWPQDLGISDPGFNFRNEPYWNLGCATQNNMAAQIADPIDLVRGRTEGQIDTVRRARDIDNLRQGKDPSTQFRQDDKRINQTVGN